MKIKKAFKIFAGDYEIVKHSNTPLRTPFEAPNNLDQSGNRQYNLTQIPENMTEEQFIKNLKGNLVISCMDRDVAKPFYDRIKKDYPQTPIIFLSMAGGIVQERNDRKQALKIILEYISKHQENIVNVIATDHDHTCGYVKYELGGTPLAEKIGSIVAEKGKPATVEEQNAMKSLIIQNVKYFNMEKLFGNKLKILLVKIKRDPNNNEVELDNNFSGIEPKTLTEL